MKISTAEIKMLIKECVKTPGVYTCADFKNYIEENSTKEVTRSQITGAIAQLVDTKDIEKIERGLYSKDKDSISHRREKSNTESENVLKTQIYTTLINVEKELSMAISSIDVWSLNDNNFDLVMGVRDLKERIEKILDKC